jgi:hypothetical protein
MKTQNDIYRSMLEYVSSTEQDPSLTNSSEKAAENPSDQSDSGNSYYDDDSTWFNESAI